MVQRRFPLAGMVLACVAGAHAGPAFAQLAGRSLANAAEADAVLSRPRLAYDAVGIDLGAFVLYPQADVRLAYNDNVYNSNVVRRADGNVVVSPDVTLRSQWSRHSLTVDAGADIQRWFRLSTEDNDQYHVTVAGRADIGQVATFAVDGGYARRIEPRGTLGDVIIGGEPTRYDVANGRATATVQAGDVLLTANGGVEYYDYLPIRVGDTRFVQDYRDRKAYSTGLRVDYAVGPGLRAFVDASGNFQRYRFGFAGIDQNSEGYAVLAGVSFGITELISGEIGVGYLSQSYDEPSFPTVSGVAYSGKVVWNPTTLITVTASGARTLRQSPFFDQAGVLEDTIGLQVDYELLRNLLISAAATRVVDDYRGVDRHERRWVVDLAGRYLINRVLEFDLGFNHRDEQATGLLGRRYAGSTVSLGLRVKK